jgi:hypothetical protein
MIDRKQETPCIAVVNSNRQKHKAGKGTEVEVRKIKEGQYGFYAICFLEGLEDPVFFSLKALDFVSDVTEERKTEIESAKAKWFAEKNAPVVVGKGEVWKTGKSVVIPIEIGIEATDQSFEGKAWFPLSQLTEKDGLYSAPQWLAQIKAVDATYFYVSGNGRKGIEHLGGSVLTATYQRDSYPNTVYLISVNDLIEARSRAA